MEPHQYQQIRKLFDDYLRMYANRDDTLTTHFSDDFSGFTGGGDFLVKNKAEWVGITRQDFNQVKESIRIELKDLAIQSLTENVAITTGFFKIHLPIKDHILSRETARLVLVFRREGTAWKICHSGISIPYHLVREGEVYPMQELTSRNQALEATIAERTAQLSVANEQLHQTNQVLTRKIAEHQRTEEALQRSEELHRSILQASPDDITITDAAGRIVMVSPMAMKMYQESESSAYQGRLITDFIVPEDRARALEQVTMRLKGVRTNANEYRGLRPNGSTFEIEVNSDFIRNSAGLPTGMVVIVRDITERKQAEAERNRLETQNWQLQKSESLGRMAGAIAHNFNNQLQAVMMSLELAMGEQTNSTKDGQGLAVALQAARKAAEVSRMMLTYLGQSQTSHEPADLTLLCRQCLPLLVAGMPKHVNLVADLPETGPSVEVNTSQIQQLLTNLITNAWEACGSKQGRIDVRIGTAVAPDALPDDNRFPIEWQPHSSAYACLSVTDTGSGIAPEDIDKLFDPFFSRKFAGRGLGLPVVLGIVRAHDGAVTVESIPGSGSTFRIFLPISTQAAPPEPIPSQSLDLGSTGGTVLFVDDNPAVRQSIEPALRHAGYQVLVADNGLAAVELLRQDPGRVDCVLCDMTMPGLNGWETLAALRKLAPGLPVILASGFSRAEVMAGDHPEKPQAFLHKPYQMTDLVTALRQAMQRES